MTDLITVQSLARPKLPGYRVVGEISSEFHRWSDWILRRKMRRPQGRRHRRDGRLRKRREWARA